MTDLLRDSYETIPYESRVITLTDIARMEAAALLHGLEPPDTRTARVLEVGCAHGGNIIPMACRFPEAEFFGIDLAPTPVAKGQKDIAALGLGNVRLQTLSILDVTEEHGLFDYIIAHGVYSWVPPEVQDAVLRVCARNLAPNGVAYVSYNTFPGWHPRIMARDMMMSHDDPSLPPRERIDRAHQFLERMAKSAETLYPLYAEQLRFELDILRKQQDFHFLHEQLEQYNAPVYFSEFARRAGAHGLRFVAEARLGDRVADATLWLDALEGSSDLIRAQQYRDYATNRAFRRSLLCADALAPRAEPDPAIVTTLHVALRAQEAPLPEESALPGPSLAKYAASNGAILTTSDPLMTAALGALSRVAPASLTFRELLQRSNDILSVNEPPGFVIAASRSPDLAEALLKAAVAGIVDLTRNAPNLAATAGERPLGSRVARRTDRADLTPDLLHRHVAVTAFDGAVLNLLDGSNDRAAILDRISSSVADGSVVPDVEAPDRAALKLQIDAALRRLALAALLEAEHPTQNP